MKKVFFFALTSAVLMTSCKKDSNIDCPETVDGIAGSYKVSKITLNGADFTPSVDACQLNGVYRLNADKSAVYTESGSGCSTTPDTGTWDMSGPIIRILIGDNFAGTVVNNCSGLTLTSVEVGRTLVTTFTKQ